MSTTQANPTQKSPPKTAPPDPRYPRLKYRAIPEAPGFAYTKVNSADEEAALTDPKNPANQPAPAPPAGTQPGTQPPLSTTQPPDTPPDGRLKTPQPEGAPATPAGAFQWFDTPAEAQLGRAQGHRPYEEYGRDVAAPVGIPSPLRPQFISQMEVAAADASAAAAAAGPQAAEEYPLLYYQAIEESPGYKYVKVMNADEEATLNASNAGTWYKTPAEAIAKPPASPKAAPAGQRPTQTSTGSATGSAAPEGTGGPSVPQPDPHGQAIAKSEGDDGKKPPEKKNGGNGGKHK